MLFRKHQDLRSYRSTGTNRRFRICLTAAFTVSTTIGACAHPDDLQRAEGGSRSSSTAEQDMQDGQWANAPTDGQWPGDAYDRVPFGQLTPVPPGGAFTEFQFAVSGPPQLTTKDGGRIVTMTSKLTVHRVEDKGFNEGITESQAFIFTPGTRAPENQMDESHGTHTDVACEENRPPAGGTTKCDLSFTAPASEIQNSYWTINRWDVGTWPSQR